MGPIRVLIIDDSALIRSSLPQVFQGDGEIELAGTAADGLEGVEKVHELNPDVVVLDIHMPRMDGLQVLQYTMKHHPVPTIMFSSAATGEAEITLEALRLGAVDFLAKPRGNWNENFKYLAQVLVLKIKTAKAAKFPTRLQNSFSPPLGEERNRVEKGQSWRNPFSFRPEEGMFIVLGCSTGGPRALERIIPSLPADFPSALGIVQHMPEPFAHVFAKNLDRISALRVKIADPGEPFVPGQVLMAPGDANLRAVQRGIRVVAALDPLPTKELGQMSSVDSFFCSVARTAAKRTLGILLTGMGRDGVQGMAAIKIMGGKTIAQDEASSAVFGMPKAAIESGAVDCVVPLEDIPALLGSRSRGKT